MYVKLQLERCRGRHLPWRQILNQPAVRGALHMFDVAYRSGHVTVLELRDSGNQTEAGLLATLYEPVLLGLGDNVLRFRGYERASSEEGAIGFVQEWRCELLPV